MNNSKNEIEQLISKIEVELQGMHDHQVGRAQSIAQRRIAGLTREDLLNPDNFPEVINDPNYTYEDGQAAGILSAKLAVRALLIKEIGD